MRRSLFIMIMMIREHRTSVAQTIGYTYLHLASWHKAGYSLVKLESLVCVGCTAAASFFHVELLITHSKFSVEREETSLNRQCTVWASQSEFAYQH